MRLRSYGTALASLEVILGGLTAASAKDRFDWVEFFPDEKPHTSRDITEKLSIGHESKLSAQHSDNLNLDLARDEDEDEIQSEYSLGVFYDSGGALRSYAELDLITERLGGFGENTRGLASEVTQAYLTYSSRDRNQALSFGRFDISDVREWLFDEEVDGVHCFRRGEKYAVELMYGREQILKKDLLDARDDNEPDHFYARAYANLSKDALGSVYGLAQFGHDSDDADLFWLGASLAGEPPIAGLAELDGDTLRLRGEVLRPDGSAAHAGEISGPVAEGQQMGRRLAQDLKEKAGEGFFDWH